MGISLLKIALLSATVGYPCFAASQQESDGESFDLTADSYTFDGSRNLMHFRGLRITQGDDISIEAAEALTTQPLDFDGSEWRFTGGVRIVADSVVLESDTAIFAFRANELVNGNLEGTPASFTDENPNRERRARGSANKLSYDYTDRTLRMTDNAQLSQGTTEIVGCDLIYDFKQEQFASGSSECGEQFRIRFPREEGEAATDAASAP